MKNKITSNKKIVIPQGAGRAIASTLGTTPQTVIKALAADFNRNSYLHLKIRQTAINDFFGQYK